MALTFPADTSQPYIDTTSGLKYVYNPAVGAWESAIQPPVIITDQAPSIELDGFLWYDTVNAAVYIRFGENWVLLTNPGGGGDGGGGGGGSTGVTISATPPDPAVNGQLWWDNNLGRLFIYYIDPSTDQQWLEASPNIDGVNGGGAFSGPNAPTGAVEGDLWYNTTNGELSVYINGSWETVQSQIEGVAILDAVEPIFLTGTDGDPIVNIRDASSATKGALRFATQSEVAVPTLSNVALSPATLQNTLGTDPEVYIADATKDSKGIVELATGQEAIDGVSTTTAVTPAALNSALGSIGTSVVSGTVIMVANGSNVPEGYLLCNGASVSRTTYSNLFSEIDVLYGAGDGSTTFNIPDMSGAIPGLSYGAYCIKT
jgi:hypothetical protein